MILPTVDGSWCNHTTFWSARRDCQDCRDLYGHMPDSPAFTGNELKKWIGLLLLRLGTRQVGSKR